MSIENKTRMSKVGAISKAQKAQNIFWKNFFSKFSKNFFFRKKSHNAEKNRRGALVSSGFVGYVKKLKNERGDPLH